MKITGCYIENFGKISGERFEFSDGLNTIVADNGYGKTTLTVFIKCMLYGMSDTKKMSLDENDRKKYLPWSGASAGGSLSFSAGGKNYRIERSFAPKAADDRFALFDADLGRESSDFSENIGEELFSVDAESFERTLFLSERSLSPKNNNKSISAKLSELVGCDGDISSMDGALKILEEQRKIYAKKGGSGEISDIKAEISRLDDELAEIERCESRMKSTENTLAELHIKEAELKEEERGIIRERESLAKRSSAETYKNTVADMKGRLSVSENRKAELIDFFGGNVPSTASIDRAKAMEAEARRLKGELETSENEEYTALKAYFTGKATFEQIEEIKECFDRVRRGAYDESPVDKRRRVLFAKRTPTVSEVETEIAKIKASVKKPMLPTVILISATVISLLGILLGAFVHPALSLLAFAGVISAILVPLSIHTKHKNEIKRLRKGLYGISDEAGADKRDPLIIYEEMLTLLTAEESGYTPLEKTDRERLSHFAFLFGKEENLLLGVGEILNGYERYRELEAVEKYKAEKRLEAARALKSIKEELALFISGFKYTTDRPIDEAAAALAEYTRVSNDIIERGRDIANLTSNHKIEEAAAPKTRTAAELEAKGTELSSLFSDIAREKALLDRQYRADNDRIDSREEILSRRVELAEKLDRYTENLEIIRLTKKYLEDARESMTSKYLGKTRAAFEKYTEELSGECGEYEMDTSFGVSKVEGAKTHTTEAYSRGMRDLYNLAARFALIDSLYEKEEPFVILDDPFTALDDKKTAAALKMLREFADERQIIYFTCSKSRA